MGLLAGQQALPLTSPLFPSPVSTWDSLKSASLWRAQPFPEAEGQQQWECSHELEGTAGDIDNRDAGGGDPN